MSAAPLVLITQPSSLTTSPPPQWFERPAAARLTGLSEGHLRRMCAEVWQGERQARQEGTRWLIRADAHPALLAPPPSSLAAVAAGSGLADLRQFTRAQRDQALQRKAILDRWERHLAAGKTMKLSAHAATNAFVEMLLGEGVEDVKRSTLYNWANAFKQDGLAGLIDGRSIREAKSTADDPFLDLVKSYYLDQRRKSKLLCYEMALPIAQERGWQITSYSSAKRFLNALAPVLVTLKRHGETAFTDKHEPFANGDFSPLESNEMWRADHHEFDVMVQVDERLDRNTGAMEPVYRRPWLTAWMDMRSRKIVGWVIRWRDPNTDAIIDALDMGLATHGVPWALYTDNGKDFDSYHLTGVTKKMRWQRRKLKIMHDQKALGGIYAGLEARHIHALPYHPQSKPIERFFRTLEDRFGRTWDTYFGSNPQQRPEDFDSHLAAGHAPHFDAFVAQFAQWLEHDYHQRVHTGDAMGDNGISGKPADEWAGNFRTKAKKVISDSLREVVTMRRVGSGRRDPQTGVEKGLTVGQNGVSFRGQWYGQYELASHYGKEVFLRIDSGDVSRVTVWTVDDQPLGLATSNLKVARNASNQQLSDFHQLKKHARKALRGVPEARMQLAQDFATFAQIAAATPPRSSGTPPTGPLEPPGYMPLRSPLEEHLPQLQKMKKAVGDGVVDEPAPRSGGFQYFGNIDGEGRDAPSGFAYHGGGNE